MKITTPLPDTEQSLFYSAINALRISGAEGLADDLDQRMENLIYFGTNQAQEIGSHILSNIGEDVVSIEPRYRVVSYEQTKSEYKSGLLDNIYIETASGQTYSVSIMECEE